MKVKVLITILVVSLYPIFNYGQTKGKIDLPYVVDNNLTLEPYLEKIIKYDSENLCVIKDGFYMLDFTSDRTFMVCKSEISNDEILMFDSYTIVNDNTVLIRNYNKNIYTKTSVTKQFEYIKLKNDLNLQLSKVGASWYFKYSKDSIRLYNVKFCDEGIDILKLNS